MEGKVNMEYRLTIAFAELGHSLDLPDRLLTILLETMPEAGPVIGQDIGTGEMDVTLAFESDRPTKDVGRITSRLDSALARAGVDGEPTVLDVHVEAVFDDEGIADVPAPADAPVPADAPADALQPA
jgi:hypothetical protein